MGLDAHAKSLCELRLCLENAHLDPAAAKLRQPNLEYAVDKIPNILMHLVEPVAKKLWDEKYSSKVVKNDDGFYDIEDLPPVSEKFKDYDPVLGGPPAPPAPPPPSDEEPKGNDDPTPDQPPATGFAAVDEIAENFAKEDSQE